MRVIQFWGIQIIITFFSRNSIFITGCNCAFKTVSYYNHLRLRPHIWHGCSSIDLRYNGSITSSLRVMFYAAPGVILGYHCNVVYSDIRSNICSCKFLHQGRLRYMQQNNPNPCEKVLHMLYLMFLGQTFWNRMEVRTWFQESYHHYSCSIFWLGEIALRDDCVGPWTTAWYQFRSNHAKAHWMDYPGSHSILPSVKTMFLDFEKKI